jgi:hypothetical protein
MPRDGTDTIRTGFVSEPAAQSGAAAAATRNSRLVEQDNIARLFMAPFSLR